MSTTTTTRTRRIALLFALLATLGFLASCGSSDSGSEGAETTEPTEDVVEVDADVTIVEATTTTTAPEATTTTAAATTTTTAPAKPALAGIQNATSLEPNGSAIDPTDEFSTDNTVIYSSVQMKPFPKGTVVVGTYEMDGTKLTDASITSPSDFDDIFLQFKLTSGGTFEAGEYTFTVTVDGEEAGSTTFTVTA